MTTEVIGQPLPMVDGRPKVTGRLTYTPDITLPGMVHARLVISPYAHARIRSLSVEEARRVPGVIAILTAQDMPDVPPRNRHLLLLARDRVIFAGQPVALVLAESEAAAEDAAELVAVEYEPLPAAVTIEEALAPDAPVVWPDGLPGASEEAAAHGADVEGETETTTHPNIAQTVHFHRGDVRRGLEEADIIVEYTFTTPWVHQNYLEPHATVVQPNPETGGATVWTSTQAPFYIREEIAAILGVPESDVQVHVMPVGGGFGGKFILYEPLIALAARQVGRPVRLVLTRMEEMLAGNPAPAMRCHARLGAKEDGTLLALEADLVFDGGCYPSSPLGIAALLMGSYYNIPHVDIRGREVLTFKPSSGAYRAPGAPQATFVIESLVDEVARRLQLDPLTIRLRHAARPGDPMVNGKPWGNMGLVDVLRALENHPAWRAREEARRQGHGVGIAIGGWPGGTEPAAAACRLERDGTLHIHVGAVDLTGTRTAFVQMAAAIFGLPPEKVRVVVGDTDTAPYAGAAGGSKTLYTLGPALIAAVEEARRQVLAIAAELLEAAEEDLEIQDGYVQVRGAPDHRLSLAEIASQTMQFGGRFPPIMAFGRHADRTQSPGFSAQLAEVSVDPETGQVHLHRLVVVQDVGRAINPLAVEGQMQGGAMQGIGWALTEAMIYNGDGQLITATWADYTVPQVEHLPDRMETVIVEVPTDHGPLGARGVGEPPVVPTAAAIANALADALGVRFTELPITPERIVHALRERARTA